MMQDIGSMERVRVQWRRNGEILPALRDGNVLGWDYLAPDTGTFGRSFLLIDLGVKLTIPPFWIQRGDPIWYVDLAIVTREDDLYRVIDLDIDVFVPVDGRPYRILDLDEFADAIDDNEFTLAEATDGLRRWQRFLDAHLHLFGPGDVQQGWRDFPPAAIASLDSLQHDAFTVREH
jgi:hypothetical protein